MNERIKELAFKAADGMLSYDGEGEWRLSQKEVEKFAELIVRDCISQIAIIGISNDENEDILWTVDLAILNIKDRFGMK